MDEGEFFEIIDCRFPYHDLHRALELAREGVRISPEAAFRVVYEVCAVPRSASPDVRIQGAVLEYVERNLVHPLAGAILRTARSIIQDRWLSTAEQIELLRDVAKYPGQHSALDIALYASDPAMPWNEDVDRLGGEIASSWEEGRGNRP